MNEKELIAVEVRWWADAISHYIDKDWNKFSKIAKLPMKENELCNLRLIGNNWYRFSAPGLCEEWPKNKIFINAVVGEANNKVEKIIIFFK